MFSKIYQIIKLSYEIDNHKSVVNNFLFLLNELKIIKSNDIDNKLLMDDIFSYFKYKLVLNEEINKEKNKFIEILYYLTISCFYVDGYKNMGYWLSELFILNRNTTFNEKTVQRNESFYVQKLEGLSEIKIYNNPPDLKYPKEQYKGRKYHNCNPSIIQYEDGYLINIRCVNYDQFGGMNWINMEIHNKINTRNYILKCDKKFNVIWRKEIIDKSWKNKVSSGAYITGMEDLILFKDNQENVYFSFTSLDIEPYNIPKQNIAKINKEDLDNNNTIEITQIVTLNGPNGLNRCEKNWLPISFNYYMNDEKSDYIPILYSHEPLKLLQVDRKDFNNQQIVNAHELEENRHDKLTFSTFRGSGKPILLNNMFNDDKKEEDDEEDEEEEGWLSIIHYVVLVGQGRRYYHRFVYYNKNLTEIKKISLPYYFDHNGVEFCRDICLNEDNIIIAAGIEDHESKFYSIKIDLIKEKLIDINNFIIDFN